MVFLATSMSPTPSFRRYIGIDYSGAKAPTSSLSRLRIYEAEEDCTPYEVLPPPSRRKYWTRRGAAEWLMEKLREDQPTLVGIDHAFSFPMAYFQSHALPHDWDHFLDDFCHHWPTDGDGVTIDVLRKVATGLAGQRQGSSRWRRITDRRAGGAKSVFHFDVQGQVAKSTHAGLPWLRRIRLELSFKVWFWPFDGWNIPVARSAVVEVYPRLWSREFPLRAGWTKDQHDAYSVAAWLSRADRLGQLSPLLQPSLTDEERSIAQVEGWILGI
jgi:hypothetical protein